MASHDESVIRVARALFEFWCKQYGISYSWDDAYEYIVERFLAEARIAIGAYEEFRGLGI